TGRKSSRHGNGDRQYFGFHALTLLLILLLLWVGNTHLTLAARRVVASHYVSAAWLLLVKVATPLR
ncbi:MAG: hypothetical protein VXV78_07625, partial [Pseudomonadota bacterium]|nr:hypothetical protein [Pseudomonadota bacterium]